MPVEEAMDEAEELVPVLFVSKNGRVIHTIPLHDPSAEPPPPPPEEENEENVQVLFIGRHPDCDIVLDHPSISRYHLQIQLRNSARQVLLTDLSSVHGTWICGQRATPHVPVRIGQNDTFRMGASSRLYTLQWVPLPLAVREEEIDSFLTLSQGEETLVPALENENQKQPLEQRGILVDKDRIVNNENEHDAIALENEDGRGAATLKEEEASEHLEAAPWIPVQPSAPPLPDSPQPPSPQQLAILGGREANMVQMQENQTPMRQTDVGEAASSLWSRRRKTAHLVRLQTNRIEGNSSSKNVKGVLVESSKQTDILEQGDRDCVLQELQPEKSVHGYSSTVMVPHLREILVESGKQTDILEQGDRGCVLQELQPEKSVHGSCSTVMAPQNEDLYASDKENLTPRVSGQAAKAKAHSSGKMSKEMALEMHPERVPFQSLSRNSKTNCRPSVKPSSKHSGKRTENRPGLSSSEGQSFDQALGRVKHLSLGESKKKWHMVVDTGCLIDEESRQALKQLEGIKGTRLIIPRIVIRELDCLERRSVSKKVNAASAILRWIEECMMKTGWWVHVQNSTESSLSMGVTPPASPHSHPSDGSNASASVAFSSFGSFVDVLSPTAEDHILECALLFNRFETDGRVVLLTNNTALKIKAMAEGMVCENAKEFCESLVSPYSERFLWSQSTAHGHNLIYFNPNSSSSENVCVGRSKPEEELKKRSNECAKGLKLILLHNSHYGQRQALVKH